MYILSIRREKAQRRSRQKENYIIIRSN